MVRHDVDDDFHPSLMHFGNQALQIIFGTVIRIDRVVIANGVRTADSSLLLLLTDGMNWHQPENRYPKIFQTIELRSDTVEISDRRKVTRIDFVDDAVAHPFTSRAGREFREVSRGLLGWTGAK